MWSILIAEKSRHMSLDRSCRFRGCVSTCMVFPSDWKLERCGIESFLSPIRWLCQLAFLRLEHLSHTRRLFVRFPIHMLTALDEMPIRLRPSSIMNFTSTQLLKQLRAVQLIQCREINCRLLMHVVLRLLLLHDYSVPIFVLFCG